MLGAMRIDGRLFGWGLFFLLVGGIPLAVDQGWLPDDVAWWSLWPLLIVGIGLAILLRRTPAAGVGGLIVALTLGALVGGTLANGISGFGVGGFGCGGSVGSSFPTQSGAFTDDRAEATIDMSCGDVTVDTGDGAGWSVSGTSDGGRAPQVEAAADSVHLRVDDAGRAFLGARSDWQVQLPRSPVIDLSGSVNAGSGTFRLAGASLGGVSMSVNAGSATIGLRDTAAMTGGLSLSVNAGSAKVDLPTRSLTGSISANAGSVAICAAIDEVGLRISLGGGILAGNDFADRGLVKVDDDTWQSPNYTTATEHIDLNASASAGSINLNPEDGCQ